MQFRTIAAATITAIIAIAAVPPATLHAQAAAAPGRMLPVAVQLQALASDRAARWASAAPVIRCAPAPLTERPGVAAELARPHVAPLEAAFLDAVIVKRMIAARPLPAGARVAPGSD